MIIDCHGHYTTEPKPLMDFRQKQVAAVKDGSLLPSPSAVKISDDEAAFCQTFGTAVDVIAAKLEHGTAAPAYRRSAGR